MDLQKNLYTKPGVLWLLAPLAALFYMVQSVRRFFYAVKVKSSYTSSLPVIVVGNITVGGSGKTPVTLALVEHLKQKGFKPAILSRGYGANHSVFPRQVTATDSPHDVGDEPSLMCKRADIPVVIDPKRARGIQFIEHVFDVDIVICDDGLQHYGLNRDVEICVMDKRGLGNGYLLPLGPLREPKNRLDTVDYILLNGENPISFQTLSEVDADSFGFSLVPVEWRNVANGQRVSIADFATKLAQDAALTVTALAGIGDPNRFFQTLIDLDINASNTIAFADHHAFVDTDIPNGVTVLMTEKDAVKCHSFAHDECWYLVVEAQLPEHFFDALLTQLMDINYVR